MAAAASSQDATLASLLAMGGDLLGRAKGRDWRGAAEVALALAWAVGTHPLVFYPTAFLLSLWLAMEVAFYFYLRYIVLPELNRLGPQPESVHLAWDQFHKTIDLVALLKGVRACVPVCLCACLCVCCVRGRWGWLAGRQASKQGHRGQGWLSIRSIT